MAIKPINMLNSSLGSRVIVELKGGRQYRGVLDGFDPHMNLVLKEVEEYSYDTLLRRADLAVVRGDNVIYISP